MRKRTLSRSAEWILVLPVLLGVTLAVFAQAEKAPETATAKPHSAAIPDLSGVWLGRNATAFASEPPMQPWAEEKFKAAKPGTDPLLSCLAPGVPRIMLISSFPLRIVQIPGQVIMLFEYDHWFRQIATDRKEHPKDLTPTWMGDPIGRWEGDTLVVDTVGFNDKTWLDQAGHPHSSALHVIERIRRTDHDTLRDDITIDDPKAYTKPWTIQQVYKLRPGWNLEEHICEDNMPDWSK